MLSPDSLMRSSIFALAAALAVAAIPTAQPFAQLATMTPAPSQNPQFTSDPEAWRPVAHYDLALPTGEAEAYASIWQDRLDESNRKPPPAPLPGQKPNPAMSYAVGNRGASEWNFSINFQSKLVVLTVLHTPHVCTDEYPSPSLAAKIKVCPMRLVTFEGDHYSIIDGAACFLLKTGEGPIEDSNATMTLVSYDVNVRAFKIRYTVSHTDIAQCAQTVLLHPADVGVAK